MKLNEIIELNGKEYTVELNRESIVRIEQYINMEEAMEKIAKTPITDKSNSEILEDENPFAEEIKEEEIEKINIEKVETIKKVYSRAFWIWLYPTNHLSINEVCELIEDAYKDDEKAEYISNKYKEFTEKSIEVRKKYLEEQKNLKALTK